MAPREPASATRQDAPTAGSTVLTGARLRAQKELTTNLRSQAQSALEPHPYGRHMWLLQEVTGKPRNALPCHIQCLPSPFSLCNEKPPLCKKHVRGLRPGGGRVCTLAAFQQVPLTTGGLPNGARSPELPPGPPPVGAVHLELPWRMAPRREAPACVLSSSVIPANRKQISVEVKSPHP